MPRIEVRAQAVDHVVDGCRMTFSMTGATAELVTRRQPKRRARAASRGGGQPSLAEDLLSLGFEQLGDQVTISSVSAKRVRARAGEEAPPARTLDVTLDVPADHYVLAVVSDSREHAVDWHMPEPVATVTMSTQASAFRGERRPGAQARASLPAPATRVTFRIPMSAMPPERRGVRASSVFGRIVRFFTVPIDKGLQALKGATRKIKAKLAGQLSRFVDRKLLGAREGLKLIRPGMELRKASKRKLAAMQGKPVFLFVHGIFSSTKGAFGKAAEGDDPPIDALFEAYDGRVLGFDHHTVSKSTLENARDLVDALPKGARLNIACHSRGGGVVRCLLEHPKVAPRVQRKGIEVDTVLFVAGACLGSPLARPQVVDRLVNGVSRVARLAGAAPVPVAVAAYLFKLFLHGVQELPGIEAMNPDAPIFARLNGAGSTLAKRYEYIRANFDPRNIARDIADQIVIDQLVFSGKANDVVVPFRGAGVVSDYPLGGSVVKRNLHSFGSARRPETEIWHTNFFGAPEVRSRLKSLAESSPRV